MRELIQLILKEETGSKKSKLYDIIYNYIDNLGLNNLEEFDGGFMDWDEDEWVDVTLFGLEEYDPIIEYFHKINTIVLGERLDKNLKSMFGNKYKEPFLNWFNTTYKLNVKELW